jgi:peptide/nickel transport system substrate-binding protein
MSSARKIWIIIAVVVVVAAGVTVGVINSSSPNSAGSSDTVTFAEAPGANPNYIFPYMGSQYFSVDNINQFQQLMFRPLYWFGLGGSVAVQPALSLAAMPVFTNANKTVTITMKGWKFADGQVVDAQSVMFFLNMYKADPGSYAGYNPGFGIPDQVQSATGQGNVVTLTFKTSVNPNWLLYNYLSEITPFPNTWDVTAASTPSHCATGAYGAAATIADCKAVEKYLDNQASKVSTYTNAMWQSGVDGPWKLSFMDTLGNVTFVPNSKYSGPQKAQVKFVKEVPFTSSQAEQSSLQAGTVDIGFLDPTILTKPAPSVGKAGPNWSAIAGTYDIYAGTPWSFNYAPFNFSSANPNSALVRPLYIRQALQLSLDQVGIIKSVDKGYGVPTYSPLPPNTPASISGPVANPYPYNKAKAKALLASHGWKVESGVQTCVRPGTGANQCGAGIANGQTLNFQIVWASGSPSLDQTFSAEISDWASIGIKFAHSTATFNTVIADCTSSKQHYELCSWGAGWIYAPDYYPSGETLFTTTGGFNPGGYSDATMNQLINATTFGTAKLTQYATYAAQQLPVLYQPNPVTPIEIIKTLKSTIGFTPNPLANFMPEYYHY